MNTAKTAVNKRVLPIKFSRLIPGSRFTIFAEPSRNIRKSDDKRVYIKEQESFSVNENDSSHAIILYPDDLVVPLSRGRKE